MSETSECRSCGFPVEDDEQLRCRCCGMPFTDEESVRGLPPANIAEQETLYILDDDQWIENANPQLVAHIRGLDSQDFKAAESYASRRLSQPFNWTGLHPAALVDAGRIQFADCVNGLMGEFRNLDQSEIYQILPRASFWTGTGCNEIDLDLWCGFSAVLQWEFENQLRDRLQHETE